MTILAELKKIEQRLDQEGDTKGVRKAFWRIVGKIKRCALNEVSIEEIKKTTEIRNRLFRHPVILSVRKGLFVSFITALVSYIAYFWALWFLGFNTLLLNGVLFLIGLFILYGLYPFGRYLGGCFAKVKFDGFYRYSPGELGLKIEYTSYLKTTQSLRKWVFGFPVIWIFTFIILNMVIAWWINPLGLWAPLIWLISFPIFYVAIYYKKTGELYRFMRERRIAQEVKRKQK